MSRLSEILKVEETQEFTFKDGTKVRVNGNLLEWFLEDCKYWIPFRCVDTLFDMIAHPDLIKPILPKLTEQQITAIKGRIAEDTPWAARDNTTSGLVWFYSECPVEKDGIFSSKKDSAFQTTSYFGLYNFITFENSPIYLPDLIQEEWVMQRLTERADEYFHKSGIIYYPKDKGLNKAICNKLGEYEDLEEQGLMIKLPCKVGAPVWTIMCSLNGKNPRLFRRSFELSMLQHLGNAVFLTKEEAEAKLREMEAEE